MLGGCIAGFTRATGITCVASITGISSVTGIAGITSISSVSGIAGITCVTSISGIAGITRVTCIASVTCVAGIARVTGIWLPIIRRVTIVTSARRGQIFPPLGNDFAFYVRINIRSGCRAKDPLDPRWQSARKTRCICNTGRHTFFGTNTALCGRCTTPNTPGLHTQTLGIRTRGSTFTRAIGAITFTAAIATTGIATIPGAVWATRPISATVSAAIAATGTAAGAVISVTAAATRTAAAITAAVTAAVTIAAAVAATVTIATAVALALCKCTFTGQIELRDIKRKWCRRNRKGAKPENACCRNSCTKAFIFIRDQHRQLHFNPVNFAFI
jgi:hypothetical protein